MISIEQIQAFTLVYQHGSYSAAGRAANKERSTIREHVMMLEDTIGVPLFSISGRKAAPTAAAHKLYQRAANATKQVEDFSLAAFSLLSRPLDDLTIYYDVMIPACWLAQLATKIKLHFPSLKVHLLVANRHEAYQAIESGECHLAIMATENSPRTKARLQSKYMGSMTVASYCHPDSALAMRHSVTMDELRMLPQLQLQTTLPGELASFELGNDIERVGTIDLAVECLKERGWMALTNTTAAPRVASGQLKKMCLSDTDRDYSQGVCVFYALSDELTDEIASTLEILTQHAEIILT
ncbi:LysR family transcriptional regulator [Thaumasiovibrio sp. DFM-14]|uniref:LysR family transcriptional regulator n=1 Tax=Thaumasiovibrio sp. DFM-14 TaxID=3384792 RepID=UPI00399FD7C4